jgi:hypothetical protein
MGSNQVLLVNHTQRDLDQLVMYISWSHHHQRAVLEFVETSYSDGPSLTKCYIGASIVTLSSNHIFVPFELRA